MIAARRAPGAMLKTPPVPREPRLRPLLARLRPRRRPLTPMSLSRWEMIVVTTLAIIAVIAVAAIGFVISYSHMHDWALANGEPEWRAKLFPLAVDGSILAASLVLYADSRAGRRASLLAYFITVIGIGWSVGANIGHAWVSWIAAMLIAGWPPVAMALSVELFFKFIRRWRGQVETEARKAARKAEKPASIPAPAPVAPEVPAPRPTPSAVVKPAPAPAPVAPMADGPPDWMPLDASMKDACLAYLGGHPDADAVEVDREVGKYIQMSDGYARRMVRGFKASLAKATEG